MKYELVYLGKLREGFTITEAAAKIAKSLGMYEKSTIRLLSGKEKVIKRSVDEGQLEQMRDVFYAAGGVCIVREIGNNDHEVEKKRTNRPLEYSTESNKNTLPDEHNIGITDESEGYKTSQTSNVFATFAVLCGIGGLILATSTANGLWFIAGILEAIVFMAISLHFNELRGILVYQRRTCIYQRRIFELLIKKG